MSDLLSTIPEWGVPRYGFRVDANREDGLASLSSDLVIDVEDNEQGGFVGVGLYDGGECVLYYSVLTEPVKRKIENSRLIAHNGKSDLHKLKAWGVNVRSEQLVFDTMLASYVIDSTRESHGLKELAKDLLGIEYPSYQSIVGKGRKKVLLDKQPLQLVAEYNAMDCLSTYKLWRLFQRTWTPLQKRYFNDLEMPVARLLFDMEDGGIKVNVPYLNVLDNRFNHLGRHYLRKLIRFCGHDFNPNSPKQIQERLFKRLACTETSTGKKVLEGMASLPIIQVLSRYREVTKLRGTYTTPLSELGSKDPLSRIHCTFNQVSVNGNGDMKGIRTGRLSCKDPNLQNQPTRSDLGDLIRSAFVAAHNRVFIDADYSQIEWRLAASFSGDKVMQKALLDGQDIYQVIADATGVKRTVAKTAALAMNYGAGGYKIADILKITAKEAFNFVDNYKKQFPQFFTWKTSVEQQEYVETIFGRRIRPGTPHLNVPFMVQGSAGDIIKKAMLELQKGGFHLVLTCHDEVIVEEQPYWDHSHSTPIEGMCMLMERIMTNIVKLPVPLTVSIGVGSSWQEAKR